ncbi:MAG: SAM-dependent methyltransferase [Rikenellaceae bacterium]
MTRDELHILYEEETRCSVEQNIERTHIDVALDKSICNSRLVATQVKYLQRAKVKLPSYFKAGCIMTQMAFEQSSSEVTARQKVEMGVGGESLLDLTCGLGVESFVLSKVFDRVVAIECDEVVCDMARENFRRLSANNIEVYCAKAEEFVGDCRERFDWVVIDPDRRGKDGGKRVVLEECSPNLLSMMDDIKRVARRMVVKLSPIFDCDEAMRLFPGSTVEVISVGGECKEVVVYVDFDSDGEGDVVATMVGVGSVSGSSTKTLGDIAYYQCTEQLSYLIIPDVSLQKSRLATAVMGELAAIDSDNCYAFSTEEQMESFILERHLGRVERIEAILDYEPKQIRKELSSRGIKRATILKRGFRYSTEQIKRQLKIEEGGVMKLAFTMLNGRDIMVILK